MINIRNCSTFFILSFFLSFNSLLAQVVSDSAVSVTKDPIPACQDSASDPDGDGWGWENLKSCRVGGQFEYEAHPICASASSDPDGDGWGWENNKSCVVAEEGGEETSGSSAFTNDSTDDAEEDISTSDLNDSSNAVSDSFLQTNFINVIDKSSSGATIEFELTNSGPAIVEYGFSANNLSLTGPVERNSLSYHKQKLTNLEAGRKYYYVINSDGLKTEVSSFNIPAENQVSENFDEEPDIANAQTTTSGSGANTQNNVSVPTQTPVSSASCTQQKQNLKLGEARGLANFHTMSLYWSPSEGRASRKVNVKFKPCGADSWRNALDINHHPVTTDLTNQYNPLRPDLETYRGSIVSLEPNTEYIVELSVEGTSKVTHVLERTRSDNFPIGRTVDFSTQQITRTIDLNSSHSGTSNSYTLINGAGSTIDASRLDYGIKVSNLKFAIIRGFKIKGARNTGILLDGAESVVIEDNEISDWGSKTDFGNFSRRSNDAIRSTWTRDGVKRLVIQRNKIFNPAYTVNSWSQLNADFLKKQNSNPSLQPVYRDRHPQGSQAITLHSNYTGNHVIRYNQIWSDNGNKLNDIIGGSENGSYHGSPGPDSDIYGNYLSGAWDDGVEAEGGSSNVRIFENYITDVFIAIGNAPVSVGPMYIFRNTTGTSKSNSSGGLGYFLKMGTAGDSKYMKGYTHVYNNSVLSESNDGFGGIGTNSAEKGRIMYNVISLNNIFEMRNSTESSFSSTNLNKNNTSFSDYSLSNKLSTQSKNESNGIDGVPQFSQENRFNMGGMTANLAQTSSSQGLDAGVVIPNFSDIFNGSAPDIGSFENGTPAKVFGPQSKAK